MASSVSLLACLGKQIFNIYQTIFSSYFRISQNFRLVSCVMIHLKYITKDALPPFYVYPEQLYEYFYVDLA
jgi:hypothetical protein